MLRVQGLGLRAVAVWGSPVVSDVPERLPGKLRRRVSPF